MPPSGRDASSLQDPAFWSSSVCTGRSPWAGRSVSTAPEPGSAVLLGPSRSGKTSFLTSLGRAFESGRWPEWNRFVPGRKLTALMGEARRAAGRGKGPLPPPTTSSTTYSFQLGFRPSVAARDSDQRRELELEASILDTPGVFFEALAEPGPGDIDESSVEALVCATRNARCLVVCVDASVEPGDGTPDLVTPVSRLLGVGSRRLPRMGAKPWPARESPWERAPRLELPFERVLLLLTKIDVLCTEVARWWTGIEGQWLSASASDIQSVAALPALGAWDIAGALDPWLLARDRIDGLDILASCLKPDAQLAVCAISADGLDTVGPHDREILTFEEQPEEGPIVSMAERASLHGDLPFGIWPALRFLIQGQVVPPLETRGPAREPQVPRPSARVELLEAESP